MTVCRITIWSLNHESNGRLVLLAEDVATSATGVASAAANAAAAATADDDDGGGWRAPGDGGTPVTLTNAELYALASPAKAALPFVYDTFEWEHCAAQGIDFGRLKGLYAASR